MSGTNVVPKAGNGGVTLAEALLGHSSPPLASMMMVNPIGTERTQDQSLTNPSLGFQPAVSWGGYTVSQPMYNMAQNAIGNTLGWVGMSGDIDTANRIANLAKSMGYRVSEEGSKLSGSRYLGLSHEKLPDTIKIRVSGHDLPPSYGSPGDIDVYSAPRSSGSGVHWSDAVAGLADRIGVDVPSTAQQQITRRANIADVAQKTQLQQLNASPAYQEAILQQHFPQEWNAAMALSGAERSAARRALAAQYETAFPGQLSWAPYLKP